MEQDKPALNAPNPRYEEAARQTFDTAPFVADVGIRLISIGVGWTETELEIMPRHYQNTGTVHAGVQATICDHSAGTAATTVVSEEEYVLSAALSMQLLRPARGERLLCQATVLKPGRRIIVVECELFAIDDSQRRLVSKSTVTLAVLKRQDAPVERG